MTRLPLSRRAGIGSSPSANDDAALEDAIGDVVGEAVRALADGFVIGVPTDTVYGLAVDPGAAGSLERLRQAKGRPETVALPVLVARAEDASDLAVLSGPAERLIARYWPGPLTIVLARRPGVDFDLGGDSSTIGVRCPDHGLLREILGRSGALAVTSANRHGSRPLELAAEVSAELGDALALVVDGGRCDREPSTVVSLAGPEPVVLRPGAVALDEAELRALG